MNADVPALTAVVAATNAIVLAINAGTAAMDAGAPALNAVASAWRAAGSAIGAGQLGAERAGHWRVPGDAMAPKDNNCGEARAKIWLLAGELTPAWAGKSGTAWKEISNDA